MLAKVQLALTFSPGTVTPPASIPLLCSSHQQGPEHWVLTVSRAEAERRLEKWTRQ